MKKFRRIMALLIAAVMVMSMGAVAFAEEDTYKITINPDTTDEGTHEYEAYQIFAGTIDKDGKLTNITWGTGIDQSKLGDLADAINALRDSTVAGYEALTADSSAVAFAGAIAELEASHDSAQAQAVAAAFAEALSSETAGTPGDDGVSGLASGYYLVQDSKAPVAPDDDHNSGAKTRYIIQVISKDVEVDEKASAPSVKKKVGDTNDSEQGQPALEDNEWQDSADYDIGDDVPFQITGTTASTAHDYIKYHVTFVDDQSDGLDAPEEFTISVLGQELTLANEADASASKTVDGIKVTASIVTTGSDFSIKVTFESVENAEKTEGFVKLGNAVDGQDIVITYTSKLNSNAVLGSTGNPNEVKLKYSNNPNNTDDSDTDEGETPKDKVIVFTYKPVVNKVDSSKEPLEGAEFTLYKEVNADYVANDDEEVKTGAEIKAALVAANAKLNGKLSALEDGKNYIAKEMTAVTGSTTSFEFKGIDDGNYVLVETKIPAGYNAFEASAFKVEAEHEAESDDPQLTELKGGNDFTGDVETGVLSRDVVNNQGAELPSTGGIGTTMFYIVGAALVIGAGVVLVSRRRMNVQ